MSTFSSGTKDPKIKGTALKLEKPVVAPTQTSVSMRPLGFDEVPLFDLPSRTRACAVIVVTDFLINDSVTTVSFARKTANQFEHKYNVFSPTNASLNRLNNLIHSMMTYGQVHVTPKLGACTGYVAHRTVQNA